MELQIFKTIYMLNKTSEDLNSFDFPVNLSKRHRRQKMKFPVKVEDCTARFLAMLLDEDDVDPSMPISYLYVLTTDEFLKHDVLFVGYCSHFETIKTSMPNATLFLIHPTHSPKKLRDEIYGELQRTGDVGCESGTFIITLPLIEQIKIKKK